MRGHEPLIAMRLGGMRPGTVQIYAGTDNSGACQDWQQTMPAHAQVEVSDDEPLSGLDLRFVVGMLVFVTGENAFRVEAIHAMCLGCGAQRVVSAAVSFDAQRPNADGVVGRVLDSAAEAL